MLFYLVAKIFNLVEDIWLKKPIEYLKNIWLKNSVEDIQQRYLTCNLDKKFCFERQKFRSLVFSSGCSILGKNCANPVSDFNYWLSNWENTTLSTAVKRGCFIMFLCINGFPGIFCGNFQVND